MIPRAAPPLAARPRRPAVPVAAMQRHACCIAAALLLAAPACTRKTAPPDPCAAVEPGALELRTREGAPELIVRAAGPGREIVCDAQGVAIGTLARAPVPAFKNAAGDVEARLEPRPGDDPLLVHGAASRRLHDENELLRVLDMDGVPLAQIGFTDGKCAAYDPAGRPVATAERVPGAEDERRAIHAKDGAVTHLVIGLRSDRAAAAFALDKLPLVERLLLAAWLDRR